MNWKITITNLYSFRFNMWKREQKHFNELLHFYKH